jgi:hypothetical protein
MSPHEKILNFFEGGHIKKAASNHRWYWVRALPRARLLPEGSLSVVYNKPSNPYKGLGTGLYYKLAEARKEGVYRLNNFLPRP